MDSGPTLPASLFVPHGAPTWALRPGAAGAALAAYARRLPRPRAIVVASAHWDTPVPAVGYARAPETIHDFHGFPRELYTLTYPATGCPEASREVEAALAAAGLAVLRDDRRGLDHGAWVPLRLMFPDADVPVVPLSVQGRGGSRHAYAVGLALAPLAARGLLVVGSGNLTHNLADYGRARAGGGTPAYVREFADWWWDRLAAHDLESLLDWRARAPEAARAHPSEEHLLPFHVALGAAGERFGVERLHAGIDDYVLAMDAFAFTPDDGSRPH
jgi:4,5-DOPA dioxygenase extradiol